VNNYKDETKSKKDIETYRVYRYIPLYRFKDLLENGMYLPRARQFEDKREGCLPYEAALNPDKLMKDLSGSLLISERKKMCEDAEQTIRVINNMMKDDFLISCWYSVPIENFIMWKAYGGSEGAVRIGVNYKKLDAAMKALSLESETAFVKANMVRYRTPIQAFHEDIKKEIDGIPTWDENGKPILDWPDFDYILAGFFYKHIGFEDERELRYLIAMEHDIEHSQRVSINESIEEITIYPYCSESERVEVQSLISHLLPDVELNPSYLEPRRTT